MNPSVVTSGVILEPEDEIKAQEQTDQAIRLMQVRFLWVKGEAIFTDYGRVEDSFTELAVHVVGGLLNVFSC